MYKISSYTEWEKERRPTVDTIRGALTGAAYSVPINLAVGGVVKGVLGKKYSFKRDFIDTSKIAVPLFAASGAIAGYSGDPQFSHPIRYTFDKDYRKKRDKAYLQYRKKLLYQ